MRLTLTFLTLGALVAGAAYADSPKKLFVSETVQINAPPDKVWAAVKDFDSLPKWHPGFASDELTSGSNGQVVERAGSATAPATGNEYAAGTRGTHLEATTLNFIIRVS